MIDGLNVLVVVHNKQQIHFSLLLESVICNLEIVFSIIVIRDYT